MGKYGIIFNTFDLHQTRFCFLRVVNKKNLSTELLLFKG